MTNAANTPQPRVHLKAVSPYKPGGKLAYDGPVALMASNENPLGPSPAAIEAIRAAAPRAHIYPDPTYTELREALVRTHGLQAADLERVVVGAGSDELIALLIQVYAGSGDEVLHTAHAFSMYRVSALVNGATPVAVPEHNLTADIDALAARAGPATKLVFLADPNNPTGTIVGPQAIERLRAALPAHVLLVVDGAYAECLEPAHYRALQDFARGRDDVAILRTFSKMYGLAALRVGWGYLPDATAAAIQSIRPPFNVNQVAASAALASLDDAAHVTASIAHNRAGIAMLREALHALGLETPDSHANFVLPRFVSAEAAADAHAFLRARGVLVRAVAGYGLANRLRVSVGTDSDNSRFLDAIAAWRATQPADAGLKTEA